MLCATLKSNVASKRNRPRVNIRLIRKIFFRDEMVDASEAGASTGLYREP